MNIMDDILPPVDLLNEDEFSEVFPEPPEWQTGHFNERCKMIVEIEKIFRAAQSKRKYPEHLFKERVTLAVQLVEKYLYENSRSLKDYENPDMLKVHVRIAAAAVIREQEDKMLEIVFEIPHFN